jgi:tetratricopeptide (TPR) repeat protein
VGFTRGSRGSLSEAAAPFSRWALLTCSEEARLGRERTSRSAWMIWMLAWGALAETRDEAVEALAHAPSDSALPIGERRSSALDFNLGKVHALAGHGDEALPRLERATKACSSFEDGMRVVRASYYLGVAQEAKGDVASARASYERVLAAWPKTPDARTPRAARARLEALRGRK